MQGKELPGQSAGKQIYVGIDVCKEVLEVYLHPIGRKLAVANTSDGLKKLKREIADLDIALVVLEATAKYHRLAQRMLHAAGYRVAVINPLRSRLFAEAVGQLAKTDPIDARILAMFGDSLSPEVRPPAPELVEELQEIVRTRQQAAIDLAAFKNRRGATIGSYVRRELERAIKNIEAHVERLECEATRRIKNDPALARRYAILTSIPGVSTATGLMLLVGMSELGSCSNKAAALLAGVAPIAADSGKTDNARHIRGGRSYVRRALYMAALSAARFNTDLKAFYQRILGKHPEKKYALTAVMRKLIVLANTLIKEDRLWQPVHP
jgi:transposase